MRAISYILFILTQGGFLLFVGCSSNEPLRNDQTNHQATQKKEPLYHCPMHPQITSDQASQTCPICGMDLVEVSTEDQAHEINKTKSNESLDSMPSEHGEINLRLKRRQVIGVQSTTVKKLPLFKEISAAGRIAFDPELYTALGEYQEALKQLQRIKNSPLPDVRKNTLNMIESSKIRLRVLGLSENQIKSIRADPKQSQNLLLPDKENMAWIYGDIYEMDLHNVRPGQKVEIRGSFLEGEILLGEVFAVDEVINPKTRTAKIRVRVNAEGLTLRPESYVNLIVFSPQGEHLSVPYTAIFDTGMETYVFVDHGDGRLEPRLVKTRFQAGEYVAIREGLLEGEKIVVSGNFLIDSESRLKGAISSSRSAKKETPQCPSGEEWHEQMNHCMKKVDE